MEKITMIKTKDGKIHKSEEEAQNYVVDKICAVLDNQLLGIHEVHPWWTRSHIMEIVAYMAKDYEKAKRMVKELNNVFE